jgi:hypothetical protein
MLASRAIATALVASFFNVTRGTDREFRHALSVIEAMTHMGVPNVHSGQ